MGRLRRRRWRRARDLLVSGRGPNGEARGYLYQGGGQGIPATPMATLQGPLVGFARYPQVDAAGDVDDDVDGFDVSTL